MSAANMGAFGLGANRFRQLDGSIPVSELMTSAADTAELQVQVPHAPAVDAGASIRETAHLMALNGFLQVEIRGPNGELLGVLTASDLFRWVAGMATGPDDLRGDEADA
jgi:CBS domain-containing protein